MTQMTKTIRHHLSDALLMSYAAGTLPEAFGLVAATHVTMCDDCRARLAALEALGGAVIEDETSVALSDGALRSVMGRLGAVEPRPAAHSRPRSNGTLPKPVMDYIGGDLNAVKWRKLGMGVRHAIIPTAKGATVRLLHIPAGQAVPDHGHRGMELTLVLQGAFRDDSDRFGPGDLEIASEDLNHTPVAEAGQDCICLAATDAPLRFNALVPRLLQPLLRI
jgi:putative transcriptional regulator